VDDTTNWKPDPFGIHELRFFSADGRPTLLVMDGGKKSYDKPPASQDERPPATDQSEPDPSVPVAQFSPPSHSPPASPSPPARSGPPPSDPAPHSVPQEVAQAQAAIPAVGPTIVARESHAHVVDPMSRPLKIAYAIVFGMLALSLLGLAYVHLRHSGDGHLARATSPTTTVAHATTTTGVPTTLSPSADAAATALVSSWSTNNRSAALKQATATAVTTLFSVPYAGGLAIARGCSTSFSPIVCTFGPPGGASPTDPIYEITVSQAPGGWYVSSVKIEN
jgi:hypothetical protein